MVYNGTGITETKRSLRRTVELEVAEWNEISKYAEAGKLDEILNSWDRIPITLKDGQEIELDVGRDANGKTYFIANSSYGVALGFCL